MHRILFSLFLCAAVPATAAAAPPAPTPAVTSAAPDSPNAAAAEFLAAFNALDRVRFDALFADDATLFFPSAPFPLQRVEGKSAVTGWFGKFFDSLRKRGTNKLNINPSDLQVQDYGSLAIVTFHLEGGDNVGRRTLVLREDAGAWKIVHLHASAEPLKKAVS